MQGAGPLGVLTLMILVRNIWYTVDLKSAENEDITFAKKIVIIRKFPICIIFYIKAILYKRKKRIKEQ